MSAAPSKPAPPAEQETAGQGFRLSIAIKPVVEPPAVAAVEVEIVARGPASDLDTWTIAAPAPGSISSASIHARDSDGPIGVTASEPEKAPSPGSGRAATPVSIQLARPPLGALRLTYTIAARPGSLSASPGVELDSDRFRASGEALLALPDAAADAPVQVALTLDITDLGDAPDLGAASSFGAGGTREVKVRGRDLRAAVFLAGHMGTAIFNAQEGHDEAAWLGYTTFDPRPIAADVASFRTAARQIFRDAESPPATLLIVADGRKPGGFVASRRAGGVLVHVGVGEPWSGAVRIAVAAEVLKTWIGERLWVGPAEPGREVEAYWFTEGVTRNVARDLLFRFGLISPGEMLDEMHGLAATIATSPHKAEPNAALAAQSRRPGVIPLLVARGALYAARVDALLRRKSGGKASLEDVLRALYAKSRAERGPLPVSAWVEAVSKELGPGEAGAFEAGIGKGAVEPLPDGALGPCFRAAPRRYEPFDLGFDDEATAASEKRGIAGLRAGGPAEKAGLRAGDVLIDASMTRGRSDVPVTLTIERGGERKTITYRPAGPAVSGPGWARKKDVPDDACAG